MAQTAATLTTSLAVPGGSSYINGGGHVLRTLVWIVSTTRAAPGCERHQKPKGQSLAIPRAGQAGPKATKRVPRRQLWPPMDCSQEGDKDRPPLMVLRIIIRHGATSIFQLNRIAEQRFLCGHGTTALTIKATPIDRADLTKLECGACPELRIRAAEGRGQQEDHQAHQDKYEPT